MRREESGAIHRIDQKRLPRHVAIIMDGNGRWAQQHAMGRIAGHRAGAESVRVIVETAREIGISYLTLYAFSAENWLRPSGEVKALMSLLVQYLRSEIKTMLKNDIRLTTIGHTDTLPANVKGVLGKTIDATNHCRSMVLNLALSYSGRDEIVDAMRGLFEDVRLGRISDRDITQETLIRHLYTADLPDPDLLIRTSGEYRLSNFLLWQSAYTELYFTEVLWPDFRRNDFIEAVLAYQMRERRFGLTSEQLPKE